MVHPWSHIISVQYSDIVICVSVLHIFPTLDLNNLPFATLQLLVSNAVTRKNGRATVLETHYLSRDIRQTPWIPVWNVFRHMAKTLKL